MDMILKEQSKMTKNELRLIREKIGLNKADMSRLMNMLPSDYNNIESLTAKRKSGITKIQARFILLIEYCFDNGFLGGFAKSNGIKKPPNARA